MNPVTAYLRNLSTGRRLGLVVFLVFLYALSHGAFSNAGDAAPSPVVARTPSAQAVVERYLKHTLSDWDSYQADGYAPPVAVSPPAGQTGPAWRVAHRYRAKNGFGAYVLKTQVFFYTAAGVYQVSDGF